MKIKHTSSQGWRFVRAQRNHTLGNWSGLSEHILVHNTEAEAGEFREGDNELDRFLIPGWGETIRLHSASLGGLVRIDLNARNVACDEWVECGSVWVQQMASTEDLRETV